jgi:hypothetical protein
LVVPGCYWPRSSSVGLVLVVTVVIGLLRRLVYCFILSGYSTDICSGLVYVRSLHYYYYCYYYSYSRVNYVQTLLVVVTVLVLMVGTAFVGIPVEFVTVPMVFALCIPQSVSIGCDTVTFGCFPPTVFAYVVVKAFSMVGGAGSFLGEHQKTCVAYPTVPP